MKKAIKKFVGSFVAVSLALSLPVTSLAAVDLTGHWAEQYMTKLVDYGFLHGYEDGTYRPDRTMTKAEIATLMNQVFGFTELSSEQFVDVSVSDWYANQLLTAKAAGYYYEAIEGVALPNAFVSREEVAVMFNNIYSFPVDSTSEKALNAFSDSSRVSAFARNAVGALANAKIFVGDENKNFNPTTPLTRAEASTIIVQSVGDIVKEDSVSNVTYEGNVLINKPGVSLNNVTIKGNLLISNGANASTIDMKGVTVSGSVIVQGTAKITADNKTSIARLFSKEGSSFNDKTIEKNKEGIKVVSGKLSGNTSNTDDIPFHGGPGESNLHTGNGPDTTNPPTNPEESKNNNLNSIVVTGYEVEKNGNDYSITVDNEETSVDVTIKAHSKATIEFNGKSAKSTLATSVDVSEITEYEVFPIVITAENGDKANYTLSITVEEDNEDGETDSQFYEGEGYTVLLTNLLGDTQATVNITDTEILDYVKSVKIAGEGANQNPSNPVEWRKTLSGTSYKASEIEVEIEVAVEDLIEVAYVFDMISMDMGSYAYVQVSNRDAWNILRNAEISVFINGEVEFEATAGTYPDFTTDDIAMSGNEIEYIQVVITFANGLTINLESDDIRVLDF